MSNDWQPIALGEVLEVKHGFAFQGEFFRDEPPGDVLVTPGNFAIGGGFKEDKLKYYIGPVPEDYVLAEGDLIVTMTDLSKEADTLGYSALVPPSSGARYLHNQRIGKIVVRDEVKADRRFLFYLLRSSEYRNEILAGATGTTVKHTAPTRIEQFRFFLPPPDEQRAIARVLGILDDKIELNRRMNRTLEELAVALFRSWFEDFDPVVAKAAGRKPAHLRSDVAALFPSTFQDSSVGEIPTGWEIKKICDVYSALFDGPHATPAVTDSGPIFLGIKNMTGTRIDLNDVRHIAESDYPKWTRRVTPRADDIVFTYEATLGFCAIIPDGLRCCLGRRMALVRCHPHLTHFLFHTFTSDLFQTLIESRAWHGSTVNRIPLTEFPNYPILWPGQKLAETFGNLARNWWAAIHQSENESRTLGALRDALLPKLLSGELRVKHAEKLVEARL